MNSEKKKILTILGIITFAVAAFAVAMNFASVYAWVRNLIGVFMPFIIGTLLAVFLNVPMKFFEKKLFKHKRFDKTRRALSIVLTIIAVLGVLSAVIALMVPQLSKTISNIAAAVPGAVRNLNEYRLVLMDKVPVLKDALENSSFDSEQIFTAVLGWINSWFDGSGASAFAKVSGTLGSMLNVLIGIIFAIYILGQKEKLKEQTRHFLDAYFRKKVADKIWNIGKLTSDTFQKFISGQCLEACILGLMFFIVMSIFKLPYALLISVLIAVTALIPVCGAFIGCAIGCLLIAVESPIKVLIFVIVFLVLQQLEGNLIYPYVVGGSIGLPSIWVLAAVTVGGKLYGIMGMLFFIPVCSVLYTLLKENVRERLKKKKAEGKL